MLERRVGGIRAGSAGTVWQLSAAGACLLWDETSHRVHEPSLRFLDHCLQVASTHLGFLARRDEVEVESVSVQVEPAACRRFS